MVILIIVSYRQSKSIPTYLRFGGGWATLTGLESSRLGLSFWRLACFFFRSSNNLAHPVGYKF